MTDIQRIPFYIEMGRDVLLAWAHLPNQPIDHAVIICPPVGHEFINSYRGLRHFADGFARKGITTFRIEYQGVGDSSGLDTDPNRIQKCGFIHQKELQHQARQPFWLAHGRNPCGNGLATT